MRNTMPQVCFHCGRTIPRGNLGDRCPACLLELALEPAEDARESLGNRLEMSSPPARRFCGDYEILGEISRGGMGVVYRARQTSVGRLVALKMIQSSAVASPEARLRFQLEAAAVGRLDHPHIVSLIESGEHEGELYFSMGLVEGHSLARFHAACELRDATWLRRAATLVVKVAQAVHYAHQRGVLHRDLKPSNILVDFQDEPRITDFGLAKIHGSDAGLTRTEAVLGSPNYMAPEQAAGPAHLLTTAADVYSLGAILYELICGRAPFEGATAVETMRRVVEATPAAPRRQNPAVDRDLESICLKCLEKEPPRRYASAAELSADLERWLAGNPTLARPVSPMERAFRWCRRNPMPAALTAISALSVAALVAGAGIAVHRVQTANYDTETLLRRLQLEQAESWLADGDAARGIALLSRLVRTQPNDEIAGIRLKSALELRPLARPITRPWLSGSEILALGFDPDGFRSVAVSRLGDLHLRDLQTGASADFRTSEGEPLAHAALSSDAAWLATARGEGPVHIWNLGQPGKPHRVLPQTRPVLFLAFDPTGARLATGGGDGAVHLWDTGSGTPLRAPLPHPAAVRVAAFSPAGSQLATGGEDGVVRLWPVESGDVGHTLERFPAGVRVLGFDAAGERMAAGTVEGQVRVWDLDPAPVTRLDLFFPAVLTDLQFSPNGHLLAVAGWSPHATVQVWKTNTGQAAGPPLAHRADVTALCFSPDGRGLLTLSMDTTARVWNTSDWTPAVDDLVHVGGVARGAWTGDSRRIATGSYAGVVWWELPEPGRGGTVLPHPARVLTAATAAQTGGLLTFAADGTLREWGTNYLTPIRELQLPVDAPGLTRFSASGRSVAVVTGREIRVFDTEAGHSKINPIQLDGTPSFVVISPAEDAILAPTARGILVRFPFSTELGEPVELCQMEALMGAALSPDGSRVATFSYEHTTQVRNAHTGAPLTPVLRHEGAVEQAVFSPDGMLLATAAADSRARVWDSGRGTLISDPLPHNAPVESVVFDPTGRFLATTSSDGATLIWKVSGLAGVPVMIRQAAHKGQAAFDPQGRFLLTVSRDHVVRVWDTQAGVPVNEPFRHESAVQQASFHAEGSVAWTLTIDGTLRQWPLPKYNPDDVAWLPDEAERIGRMYLDRPNRFRFTSVERWEQPSDLDPPNPGKAAKAGTGRKMGENGN